MFGNTPTPNPKLEEVSDKLLEELKEYSADSDEYARIIGHYAKVEELKAPQKRERVFSWDTVILAGANLIGLVVIAAYEQKHVWTSKGFGERVKPKI